MRIEMAMVYAWLGVNTGLLAFIVKWIIKDFREEMRSEVADRVRSVTPSATQLSLNRQYYTSEVERITKRLLGAVATDHILGDHIKINGVLYCISEIGVSEIKNYRRTAEVKLKEVDAE